MIGIYKYENKINHNCYIGQSIDIERRQYNHKSSAYNENANDYNTQFHQAIRKYGLDNFDFEIIATLSSEEYSKEALDELEYLKEVFKKFGGLILGKIFFQNTILKKINIGILIMLKPILLKQQHKIKDVLQMTK